MLAVERQALENPVERPPTPLYAQLSDVVQRQVNGMLTRHGDPGASMARAQRQSELVLRSAAGTPTEVP
jgi:multiple sugar transport system substrate-binding protein